MEGFNLTKKEAKTIIKRFNLKTKVRTVYDDPVISEAIITLIPGFEYPDWDHYSLSDVLKEGEKE